MLCGITESQFREDILCVELTLHDSSGELLSSFWWHRDDTAVEAGSIEDAQSMKRTIIWVFDRGHVNLEIVGFQPIIRRGFFFHVVRVLVIFFFVSVDLCLSRYPDGPMSLFPCLPTLCILFMTQSTVDGQSQPDQRCPSGPRRSELSSISESRVS